VEFEEWSVECGVKGQGQNLNAVVGADPCGRPPPFTPHLQDNKPNPTFVGAGFTRPQYTR